MLFFDTANGTCIFRNNEPNVVSFYNDLEIREEVVEFPPGATIVSRLVYSLLHGNLYIVWNVLKCFNQIRLQWKCWPRPVALRFCGTIDSCPQQLVKTYEIYKVYQTYTRISAPYIYLPIPM